MLLSPILIWLCFHCRACFLQSEQAVTQVVWLGGKGVQLPCATARPVLDILVQAKRLADAVTVSRTTEQVGQVYAFLHLQNNSATATATT